MAKLRPGRAYREIKQPYTRRSKYRERSFIKGVPGIKVVHFDMGDKGKSFGYKVALISQTARLVRHNAIEAARVAANRYLVKKLGNKGFYFKLKMYPHHVIREIPLAAGACADRYQTGMSHAFGKPKSSAAIVKEGKELMFISVPESAIDIAKEALRKAASKMGINYKINIEKEVA